MVVLFGCCSRRGGGRGFNDFPPRRSRAGFSIWNSTEEKSCQIFDMEFHRGEVVPYDDTTTGAEQTLERPAERPDEVDNTIDAQQAPEQLPSGEPVKVDATTDAQQACEQRPTGEPIKVDATIDAQQTLEQFLTGEPSKVDATTNAQQLEQVPTGEPVKVDATTDAQQTPEQLPTREPVKVVATIDAQQAPELLPIGELVKDDTTINAQQAPEQLSIGEPIQVDAITDARQASELSTGEPVKDDASTDAHQAPKQLLTGEPIQAKDHVVITFPPVVDQAVHIDVGNGIHVVDDATIATERAPELLPTREPVKVDATTSQQAPEQLSIGEPVKVDATTATTEQAPELLSTGKPVKDDTNIATAPELPTGEPVKDDATTATEHALEQIPTGEPTQISGGQHEITQEGPEISGGQHEITQEGPEASPSSKEKSVASHHASEATPQTHPTQTYGVWWLWLFAIIIPIINEGYATFTVKALIYGMRYPASLVYRHGLASCLLITLALWFERHTWRSCTMIAFIFVIGLAILGPVLKEIFEQLALEVFPHVASVMDPMIFVVTYFLSCICRLERISFRGRPNQAKVLGTLVVIAGAIIVVTAPQKILPLYFKLRNYRESIREKSFAESGSGLIGGILGIMAVLFASIYEILLAKTIARFPAPLTISAATSLLGVGINLLLCRVGPLKANKLDWSNQFDIIGGYYVYAGLLVSGMVTYLITILTRARGPVFATIFYPAAPLFGLILGSLLGEEIYAIRIVADVTMVVGVGLIVWGNRKTSTTSTEA